MPLLFCGGRHAGPQPDVSEEPSKKAEDKGTGGHAAVPAGVRQAERREILMRTVPGVMTSFYKVTQHSSTSFTLIFPILVLIQHVRIDQSNIFVYLENKSVKHQLIRAQYLVLPRPMRVSLESGVLSYLPPRKYGGLQTAGG